MYVLIQLFDLLAINQYVISEIHCFDFKNLLKINEINCRQVQMFEIHFINSDNWWKIFKNHNIL